MRAVPGSTRCPPCSLRIGISRDLASSFRAPSANRTRQRQALNASVADDGDDKPSTLTSASSSPPQNQQQQRHFLLDPFSAAPPTAASRAAASPAGTTLSPSSLLLSARVCRMCEGRGDVACAPCSGKGRLPRGGYSRKNALNVNKALGTTWTALQRTLGRTHFDVRGKRVVVGGGGGGGSNSSNGSISTNDGGGGEEEEESGGLEESDGNDDDSSTKTTTKSKKKKKKKKKSSKGGGSQTYFLMVATCDDSISLWVPAATLKDRSAWASGWLERKDLQALRGGEEGTSAEEEGEGSGRGGSRGGGGGGGGCASCRKCSGTGRVPCPLCTRAGDVIDV